MGYLKASKDGRVTESEEKQIDYIFRLSRQLLSNLKIILLCVEGLYQFYKQILAKREGKDVSKKENKNNHFVFTMKSMSPGRGGAHNYSS